jgi:hypothetical protein
VERHFAVRLLAEIDLGLGEQAVHELVLILQLRNMNITSEFNV